MLIWINGAFGVGKTTIARALVRRCPEALPFDPEQIGFLLRKAMPAPLRPDDFQDLPLWRELTGRTARGLLEQCGRPLIVPMALPNAAYFREIMDEIAGAGCAVHHFALTAPSAVIRKRIARRWDFPASKKWALAQVDRCVAALQVPGFGVPIRTDERTVTEIVDDILSRLPARPWHAGQEPDHR
jgi:hypothetical protein